MLTSFLKIIYTLTYPRHCIFLMSLIDEGHIYDYHRLYILVLMIYASNTRWVQNVYEQKLFSSMKMNFHRSQLFYLMESLFKNCRYFVAGCGCCNVICPSNIRFIKWIQSSQKNQSLIFSIRECSLSPKKNQIVTQATAKRKT